MLKMRSFIFLRLVAGNKLSNAKSYIMSTKLAKKEYVDYVNSRVTIMNQKSQIIANDGKTVLHIVIPYETMIYDKSYILITATLNSHPYVGMLCYDRYSATLYDIFKTNAEVTVITKGPEENRLLRVVLNIAACSMLKLDSPDYFEQAVV